MQSSKTEKVILIPPTLGNKLGSLFIAFFVMIIAVSLISSTLGSMIEDKRDSFLVSSVLQSVLAFVFPAWLSARLCSDEPCRYLGLNSPTCLRQYLGVLLFIVLITPFMNAVVDWNENIGLPSFMAGLERVMRQWEDAAAVTTGIILEDPSVWGLVSGILVVGCLTGFAEEMFFRAGLQKGLVSSGINVHVSIWITAAVFSAVHFQFFGFVPRMLLGAFFGYIYWYTGSVWTSAFAHALNNSTVVFCSWLVSREYTDFKLDTFGVDGDYSIWLVLSSVVASVILFTLLWKPLMNKPLCYNNANDQQNG